MNIAIIAANGRLGSELVKLALAEGHTVHAGIRGASNFKKNALLTVVDCDATNETEVKELVKGVDVVFSCIGHVKSSPKQVQTEATKVVVCALNDLGISRFVTLTGTGVRQKGDRITFIDRFLNAGIAVLDPARISDGRNHVKVLKKSTLEWTVIRVLKLQFKNNRPFTLLQHGPTLPFVSRSEAARAMLDVAHHHTFIRELPIIGR